MADTFERSCAHWSEEKRAEMDDFYSLASLDYRELARAVDWAAWLAAGAERAGKLGRDRLSLLDVACGSGKFPAALLASPACDLSGLAPIDIALLDPSAFSIAEARSVLKPPFMPGSEYQTILQSLDVAPNHFDLAWATHALYAIPEAEIDAALACMVDAAAQGGVIAHARRDAHYIRFYDLYLDGFAKDDTPYVHAERIEDGLRRMGLEVEVSQIDYQNTCPRADTARVEGFLQRCLFDDTISLEALRTQPKTGAYLEQCLSDEGWHFSQFVSLIFFQK
ncbi:MAG: class I SAM-dependent methyltransferase [Pseudomonadota bacterium]